MKALIPVAGVGTRLRPHTYTQPKPLLPVAGKPIISYIIDQLVEIGVRDFVFVIGYLGDKIKNYIEDNHPTINREYVKQPQRLGLGHAVWTAREQITDEKELFIVLGDTIFDVDFKQMLSKPNSVLGIKKVDDPRNFGVAELDGSGNVLKVVEKPKIPKSNMALVGLYKCTEVPKLIEALDYIIQNDIKTKGEFQLTDGLQHMIEKGTTFSTIHVNNWFDCGKKEVLLETNAILLQKPGFANHDVPDFENSIIIHPVSIAKGCTISNSIVGPNVTVAENTVIDSSIVKNSIIGHFSRIEGVVLHSSVIGNDASIKGLSQSLNIGDNNEIDFS